MNLKTITFTLSILFFAFAMNAQDINQEKESKATYSLEIDPSTFALKGYALHFRYKPKNNDHLLLGLGTYAMNFPDLLVDMNKENKEKGWDVRLNKGLGLFTEYHFTEVNKKWYVVGQLAVQEYKIRKDFYDGDAKYNNVILMALGGYTLQPFEFPVYFKFWGGLGYTGKISGDNSIGNATYDISHILIFGALHIGYIFN